MSDQPLQPHEEPPRGSVVCPYCGADPVQLQIKGMQTPEGLTLVMVVCANPDCRCLLPVHVGGTKNVTQGGLYRP